MIRYCEYSFACSVENALLWKQFHTQHFTYRICADARRHAGVHSGSRALGDGLAGDEVAQNTVEGALAVVKV